VGWISSSRLPEFNRDGRKSSNILRTRRPHSATSYSLDGAVLIPRASCKPLISAFQAYILVRGRLCTREPICASMELAPGIFLNVYLALSHQASALFAPASNCLDRQFYTRLTTVQAERKSSGRMGSLRRRLPVAAKMALATAGATGGTPGSPQPPGALVLGTMWTSICAGASLIRRTS